MNPSSSRPLYIQIYEDLQNKINTGVYPIDSKLPAERELESIYSVSRITAQKAVNELANEGLVERKSGFGTTVKKKSEHSPVRLLGLILPGTLESFGDNLLHSISDNCALSGYSLIIKFSNENQARESECLDELVNLNVAGILIAPLQREFYTETLMKYILQKFPIVILDKELTGLDTMFVGTNHLESAVVSATEILKHGHTNIGIVDYAEISNSTLLARKEGFIRTYAHSRYPLNASTTASVITTNYLDHNEAAKRADVAKIKDFLQHKQPTCLIALDSYVAYLCKQAIHDLHLRIPDDISFFGFDADAGSNLSSRYTYYKQDENQIAVTAVSLLMDDINHGEVAQRVHYIHGRIVDFGSIKNINPLQIEARQAAQESARFLGRLNHGTN